jgi:hypothetical protein
MSDLTLISLRGTAVAQSAIQKFQAALSGNLIRPDDPTMRLHAMYGTDRSTSTLA